MNKFATLIEEIPFRKVSYYSVRYLDEEDSLFLNFLNEHSDESYEEQLSIIQFWLGKIGNEIGADRNYFRNEDHAHALPPKAKDVEYPTEFINVDCNLRLYCLRLTKSSVILFGGGVKTAQKAQFCENVRPHFELANELTKIIYGLIKSREILINRKTGRLMFDQNLKFLT